MEAEKERKSTIREEKRESLKGLEEEFRSLIRGEGKRNS